MENQGNGSSSPISCEVTDIDGNSAREESQSRRKLQFEDGDNLFNMNVPNEEEDEGEQDLHNSVNGAGDINLVHSNISDEAIPKIDMKFLTEEAAYQFYNAYAYKVGFSVRRSKEHKDASGKLVSRIICCSCEGKRGKNKRDSIVKSHRPETRFGCLARMKIKYCRITEQYYVAEFAPVHNHMVSTPSKTHLHRSYRKFGVAQAAQADLANDSGIAPRAVVEFMARQVGGVENLGFIPQDYKNYLRSKRTVQMKVGDTGGVLEYLQKMQLEDPNFFYAIQVDEDDLITNIFWADAKMMADYAQFGDVVCFDTTYRKNKDGRPFAMFVGVNHHKQTVVFGAGLLYDETANSFIWLFDTFAKAMHGKRPQTILTDQDAAMAKALAAQWPGTVHRLCIWHIYQNAAIHLSGVFARFKDFAKDLSECIYDYEDEDEDDFIEAWNAMLEKYNLQDNDWLKRMFNIKEKWALVYGRQTFCADMTTTQRSESMNSALKRYASYNNDLLQFFHNFQRLVDNRRYKELKADFRANQSTPSLSFSVQILKHAASIYTPDVFVLVQRELSKAHDCKLEISGENGTITEYEITPYGKHHHHVVTYDSSEDKVMCSCKKFEFGGILCSHALKVLSSNNVVRIPDQYILKRWTKNPKSRSNEATCASSPVEDPKAMMGIRYKELCRLCTQMATRAVETEEAYKIALNALKKIAEEVDASLIGQTYHETSHANMSASQEINEANYGEGTEKRVKGLKVKARATRSSKRPRGALQRAIRSKRACSMNTVPVQESEIHQPSSFSQEAPMVFTGTSSAVADSSYERNLLSQYSQFSQQNEPCTFESGMGAFAIYQRSSQPSPFTHSTKTVPTTMTELLQAPLSQTIDEEFFFNSFGYEGQRKSNAIEDQDGDTFFK